MKPQGPVKKRIARKNLIAIDGSLDVVERIAISIHEKGRNAEPFELRILHRDAVREHVDCNNPDCFNGGFSLGDVLREMIRGRQEEFIGTNFCTGQEGDADAEEALAPAKDSVAGHPSCSTRFEVHAILRFR